MQRITTYSFVVCLLLGLVELRAGTLDSKIDGISWVGRPHVVNEQHLQPAEQLGANWVALIPYGFTSHGSTALHYNTKWQWWGETDEGIRTTTRLAHRRGLQVMIKPQVWIEDGSYVGHLDMKTEAAWQQWERSYEAYILHYARLAEEEHAGLFCIGTEWTEFVIRRPRFWEQLIVKVRGIYAGPITYAANWDAIHTVPFWSQLDYVGVDAYFPLGNDATPTVQHLLANWQPHADALQALSKEACVPVLFTEYGYRSVDYCAKTPWEHGGHTDKPNLTAQRNALEALLQRFWPESWFAGGFLWNWFPNDETSGGPTCNGFTPQNKPAEQVVKQWYGGK